MFLAAEAPNKGNKLMILSKKQRNYPNTDFRQ
jgi:hypothetical protein